MVTNIELCFDIYRKVQEFHQYVIPLDMNTHSKTDNTSDISWHSLPDDSTTEYFFFGILMCACSSVVYVFYLPAFTHLFTFQNQDFPFQFHIPSAVVSLHLPLHFVVERYAFKQIKQDIFKDLKIQKIILKFACEYSYSSSSWLSQLCPS